MGGIGAEDHTDHAEEGLGWSGEVGGWVEEGAVLNH